MNRWEQLFIDPIITVHQTLIYASCNKITQKCPRLRPKAVAKPQMRFYRLLHLLHLKAMTTQLNLFTLVGAGRCSWPCCCCVLCAGSLGTVRDAEMPPWHLLKDHTLGGYALLLSNEVKTHWHFAGRWIPSVALVSRWSLSLSTPG